MYNARPENPLFVPALHEQPGYVLALVRIHIPVAGEQRQQELGFLAGVGVLEHHQLLSYVHNSLLALHVTGLVTSE